MLQKGLKAMNKKLKPEQNLLTENAKVLKGVDGGFVEWEKAGQKYQLN